jgi:hypothetical protein
MSADSRTPDHGATVVSLASLPAAQRQLITALLAAEAAASRSECADSSQAAQPGAEHRAAGGAR